MIVVREALGLRRNGSLKFASLELSPPSLDHSSFTSLLYPPGFELINCQTTHLHTEKKEGTKHAHAGGKKGRKQKNNS